jgi:hypothetical protein
LASAGGEVGTTTVVGTAVAGTDVEGTEVGGFETPGASVTGTVVCEVDVGVVQLDNITARTITKAIVSLKMPWYLILFSIWFLLNL